MIVVSELCKLFGGFCVIDHFSFEFPDRSITSILAPSGAGKTTLLRIISGLEKPTNGTVIMDDKAVTGPTAEIGFMFQEVSVFPWLSVRKNIEFGARLKANKQRLEGTELDSKIVELSNELNIQRLLDLYPSQLSGGQKQRCVIARTLILKPKVILCDEPFSSLDEVARNTLRMMLLDLHRHYSPMILFITHSIEEAAFLGDQVVICSGPPLRVRHCVNVKFSTPRGPNLLDSEEFLILRRHVKEIVQATSSNLDTNDVSSFHHSSHGESHHERPTSNKKEKV